MSKKTILDHFSALEDPRQAWKVIYPLPKILLIVLCGTMAGAEDFCGIECWDKQKLAFLRRLLPIEKGAPSHDPLNDLMNALPTRLFAECFTSWVESLRETDHDIVAIDGKTSRRAHGKDGQPLHLVSAWATRQRLVLGQEAVDKKSNKIVAIPLLERLELEGAFVTIDAMGCQREIAEKIRQKGADYLLASRTLDRRYPRMCVSTSNGKRKTFSTRLKPPTATMGASRSVATMSAGTSTGSQPAVAFPESRVFRRWP